MIFLHQAQVSLLRLAKDPSAQDLIEYALMAGLVVTTAGALGPGVASHLSTIFSKVGSCFVGAGA